MAKIIFIDDIVSRYQIPFWLGIVQHIILNFLVFRLSILDSVRNAVEINNEFMSWAQKLFIVCWIVLHVCGIRVCSLSCLN